MANRKCTRLTNCNTQINLTYINHLLNLNIHKLLLILSIMTSISKAHMRDEISSNLLSWVYCCLFVVSIHHIIKMRLNNTTTLISSPKQGRLGAYSKKLSSLNFYGKQEAWTRNKPTLTCNNNNLTYWILVVTRSRLSWSSHYDRSHFLTMNKYKQHHLDIPNPSPWNPQASFQTPLWSSSFPMCL